MTVKLSQECCISHFLAAQRTNSRNLRLYRCHRELKLEVRKTHELSLLK